MRRAAPCPDGRRGLAARPDAGSAPGPGPGCGPPSGPVSAGRSGPRCTGCGSARVTSIALTLTDGSPVRFTSCHVCEHRSWAEGDRPLAFDTVLAKTRKPR